MVTRPTFIPVMVRKAGKTIVIPERVAANVTEDRVLVAWFGSRSEIKVQGIALQPGFKVIDILIRVNTLYSNQAFASINKLFLTAENCTVKLTSGFCTSPSGDDRRPAECTWQGIVEIPGSMPLSEFKETIMKINLEYDDRVIMGAEAKEVDLVG